jgi:RNA polymerase sigma-70 factor (ECF subfamily)
MFSICLRYAKDYHSAEDILQEGFIKVFKYISKFRWEGSFEGWMRRIFVNTAIEHLRKAVNLYPIVNDDDKVMDIVDESVFDHLDEQDLLGMVQRLSPGYRTVFNLYVIEGYSHKEISKMMEISEGTSKSQLARARQILQRKLEASQILPMGGTI